MNENHPTPNLSLISTLIGDIGENYSNELVENCFRNKIKNPTTESLSASTSKGPAIQIDIVKNEKTNESDEKMHKNPPRKLTDKTKRKPFLETIADLSEASQKTEMIEESKSCDLSIPSSEFTLNSASTSKCQKSSKVRRNSNFKNVALCSILKKNNEFNENINQKSSCVKSDTKNDIGNTIDVKLPCSEIVNEPNSVDSSQFLKSDNISNDYPSLKSKDKVSGWLNCDKKGYVEKLKTITPSKPKEFISDHNVEIFYKQLVEKKNKIEKAKTDDKNDTLWDVIKKEF